MWNWAIPLVNSQFHLNQAALGQRCKHRKLLPPPLRCSLLQLFKMRARFVRVLMNVRGTSIVGYFPIDLTLPSTTAAVRAMILPVQKARRV